MNISREKLKIADGASKWPNAVKYLSGQILSNTYLMTTDHAVDTAKV